MAGYNGYENYETWNVCLWLANDEPMYRAAVAFARDYDGDVNARAAARLVMDELMPDGTPDFSGRSDYSLVNWTEVANDVNDMARDAGEV